jgi:hypothetical protein
MKGNMKYKYQKLKNLTDEEWRSAPTYNAYQIQFAVDVTIGDDGSRGNEVVQILDQERKKVDEAMK